MGKIIISLLTICCRLCTASISEDTDRLLSNLFDPNNYKAEVHPKTADDGAIKVSLGVTPVHISVVRSSKCCLNPIRSTKSN